MARCPSRPATGRWRLEQAAIKLRDIVEDGTAEVEQFAEASESFALTGWPWSNQAQPWHHTAHVFGYIAPAPPGEAILLIRHAGNMTADSSLKGARIKITLDRLRVAAYPGGGMHRVLFDFYAQNQVSGGEEHLHFNTTYRVREGEQAAVLGFPIFVGLGVGTEGVAFRCYTVNVKNEQDESLLSFLDADVFKAGLRLATTLQPALAPLSATAVGLTRAIAARSRNVPVQDFFLGLDFSAIPTRARLAEGSFLAVQVPEAELVTWNWGDWAYSPASGQIVRKDEAKQVIPYNYVVFSISRFEAAEAAQA